MRTTTEPSPVSAPAPGAPSAERGWPVVLIVEDDPYVADLEVIALRAVGLQTLVLPDASELFRHMDEARPDAVVLDFMLPDQSGLQALAALLRHYGPACPPVVVATAFPDHVVRGLGTRPFEGLPVERVSVVAKPFADLRVFARTVRRMVDGR